MRSKQDHMFGNIGFPELLIILAIALLVFGPKKLPEVSRSIGKAVREFRRASDEIKGKIEQEIQASEFKEIKDGLKRDFSPDIYKEITEDKEEKKEIQDGSKKDLPSEIPPAVPEAQEEKKDGEGQEIS
jgi:TatA/E family protein of Tat protein translocase